MNFDAIWVFFDILQGDGRWMLVVEGKSLNEYYTVNLKFSTREGKKRKLKIELKMSTANVDVFCTGTFYFKFVASVR